MLLSLKERTYQPRRIGIAAAILLVCWRPLTAPGEEVSRQAPPIYREKLAALLTPLDEVLRSGAKDREMDEDGMILLDEEIHYVDEKGRRYWVDHRINKAVNDTGAKENGEEVHGYRKANQKIYLALAQTISPEGKRMPIRPGAAIMQSPQRQADDSLYDDQGELRLIFPNVKPGAVTESVVIIEESRFRIPGEFTSASTWAFGWPLGRIRRVVDLPSAMAERLRIASTGSGVPEPEKQQLGKNRTRFTWKSNDVPARTGESNLPPARQVGPVLWLTTLPDWDALVKWYGPLVNERSRLKPPLEKQLGEWTKAAHTPAEILDVLMARVAADIRYVGLEFGASDLQPHDCNEVWENQYGDCKDKANLLRAMLQRKGIAAWLVLLNTEHSGRIERRSPDYRQFNHAIVAVELVPGQYTFCDPTITFAKPGMLSPDDGDRDVLLIKGNAAEWAHTPAQDAGTLHYDFDLKLARDGEISGWVTQETSGYYGVADAAYYRKLDKDRIRDKAREIVQGFYKGAEVVDVTKTPMETWDVVYRLKTYFLVPGTNHEGQGRSNLPFPHSGSMFVNPGTKKERKTPFYTWPDTVKVTAHIRLPEGYGPSGLPHPFQVASSAFDGAAQWSADQDGCRATLELHLKQSLIPPDKFEVFFNALHSMRSWLDNPLPLTVSGEKPPAEAAQSVTLEDFPMMPNGDGQLALVEQRYPNSRDPRLRREALQKVMQYFPTDKVTLYTAGMKLAVMDWQENKAQQAVDQIQNLLRSYKDVASVEDTAWGEYMLALALKDAEQPAEALKIFERISGNSGVSARRRGWTAWQRARILEPKSATAAIKALRESLALDTDAQPAAFTMLAKLLIVDGRTADLKKEIKQLVERKPPQFAAMLIRLAESAGELLPAEKGAQRAELIQMLEDAEKSADLGSQFAEALKSSRDRVRAAGAAEHIRENLKKYLAKNPRPELGTAAASLKSPADFSRAVAEAEKDRKPELCVNYGVELLTRFEPDADFPTYLWRVTSHAEWKERFQGEPESLLPILLGLCDQLPPDNDAYIDGKLLRAKCLVRGGDLGGARKIHEELLENPALSPGFKVTVHARLAENLEALRDYRKALDIYRTMEGEVEFVGAKDALLRAALLHFEMGARDEAVRVLGILAGRSAAAIKQASTGTQIAELVELTRDKQKAEAYWDASAKWWPVWLALEQKLGVPPLGTEQIVPAIPDLQAFGSDAGMAMRAKDRAAFFGMMRRLAHAARWQPSMTMEFFGLLLYAPGMAPESADELRRFGVAVSDLFTSENPELIRKNLMYSAINCIDSAQNAKALKIIQTFHEAPRVDDAVTHTMARLWSIAAQRENRDFDAAIAALEKTIASSSLQERGLTVTALADLYRRTGRGDDEEALLKRELENPQIKAVVADQQSLSARYRQLREAGEESRQFSVAVDNWLKKWKPAWFDFAEPKALDDARLSNLDAILKEPERLFIDPEIFKLQMLVATSPGQPDERRQQAFLEALSRLNDLALTSEEARNVYEPIIDDAGFPEMLRVEALWRAMLTARYEQRRADYDKLRSHPLAAKFNDATKNSVEVYRDGLDVDLSSPESIVAFCDRWLQKVISNSSLIELRGFYARLLALGQIDAAEKIYRRLADVTIGPEVSATKVSLQMEFLKALNRGKKWAPANAALRDLVLARFPASTISEPSIYATLYNRNRLEWLAESDAQQVRLYQIKTQQINPEDYYFWKTFVRGLTPGDASQKLALDLVAATMQNAPGDSERANAITFGAAAIDNDDAGLRSELDKLFRPYRKAEEFPLTYEEIRMNELFNALRLGEPINLEVELANLHHSKSTAFSNYTKLRHDIQTQNKVALKKLLDAISPDELLADRLLALSLRAFEMEGMNDELELAREAAKKAIYRGVLQSWTTLDPFEFHKTYELAEALHDPSLVPQNWLASATTRISNYHAKQNISAEDSYLREDWSRLFQIATEEFAAHPTYYHFLWFKAVALYHLDRKQEAVEPLQVYVRYAKDELEYPQAVEWLKELGGEVVPPAKSTPQ